MNIIIEFWILASISIKACYSIINGYYAPDGYFTYQVLVEANLGNKVNLCAGTIIDLVHVLTAGHCATITQKEFLTVLAGITDFGDPNGLLYTVKEVHTPPGYPGFLYEGTASYDIAVIVINGQFDANHPRLSALPLPTAPASAGDQCIYSGWGLTELQLSSDRLKYGYGEILPKYLCHATDPSYRSYEFCFQNVRYQSATAMGDSGGPFVCNGIITGVINRGTDLIWRASTAIDVYRFVEFIDEVRDNHACNLPRS